MAKIPLPERGQPLDLSYIYQIANAVNDLSTQVVPTLGKYVTIVTPDGTFNIKASETRIVAAYKEAYSNTDLIAGSEKELTYDFPGSPYGFPPIVTATIVNGGGTAAGANATVTIKTVSTSKVIAVVTTPKAGANATIGVNFMVVGISNS